MKEIDWSFVHGEGTIVCSCDNCGHEYNYDFDNGYPDFTDCQREIKSMGWLSRKIDDEWHDFCCQECYKKFTQNN